MTSWKFSSIATYSISFFELAGHFTLIKLKLISYTLLRPCAGLYCYAGAQRSWSSSQLIMDTSTTTPQPSTSGGPSPSSSYAKSPNGRVSWFSLLVSFLLAWFAGLWDALAFNRVLMIATKSPKIYKPILNCLFLNGVIFVGSYIVFHHIIAPLLQYEAVSWIFFVVYPDLIFYIFFSLLH